MLGTWPVEQKARQLKISLGDLIAGLERPDEGDDVARVEQLAKPPAQGDGLLA